MENKVFNNFKDIVDASVEHNTSQDYEVTSIELDVDGHVVRPYSCVITHRDIFFYFPGGNATYLVDSYGDRNVAELFDWEFDS